MAPDGKPLFGAGETVTIADAVGQRLRSRVSRVELVAGPAAGSVVDLPGPSARVGSARDCDLVIADPTVSRHHITLAVDERGIRVTDAGSRNGTLVDGLRVVDAFARPDSAIAIGATTLQLRLTEDVVEVPLSPR